MTIKFVSIALTAATLFSAQAAATEETEKELSKSDCGIIKEVGGRRACRISGATFQLIIPKEAYDALPAGKNTDHEEKK